MENVADFVKAVHVQLADEGGYVGVFEVGSACHCQHVGWVKAEFGMVSYARTLENSVEGEMRKLSLEEDQDIKC